MNKKKKEDQRRLKPGHCHKYLTTIIDPAILSDRFGARLTETLQQAQIPTRTSIDRPHGHAPRTVITWERCLASNGSAQPEQYTLIVWNGSALCSRIADQSLLSDIDQLRRGAAVTLLLCGIAEHFRTAHRPAITRDRVERELLRLEMLHGIAHRHIQTDVDLAQAVLAFTKSVAEAPHKQQLNSNADEQAFYLANDNRDCVAVRGNIGLGSLWQHQLCKLPLVTLESAEAIIGAYAMPRCLLDAYEELRRSGCAANGADLLANLPVRRAGGPLSTVRKIGPELSRRVFDMFTSDDPETVL